MSTVLNNVDPTHSHRQNADPQSIALETMRTYEDSDCFRIILAIFTAVAGFHFVLRVSACVCACV